MTETTNVAENQRLERAEIERMSPEEVEAHLDKRLKHKMLHTEGLVKRYGKRTVANGVTINVKQGEIVGLLGPNGAGKTTSFYMTTGLVIPNEGHVYIDDEEITKYPVYKRARAGIGYLPQEASVFRKLSVEDNIMSVLEMTKLTHQRYAQQRRAQGDENAHHKRPQDKRVGEHIQQQIHHASPPNRLP